MTKYLPQLAEIIGAGLVAAGLAMVYVPLAFLFFGSALILAALVSERGGR